jgi:hypothetical protein
MHAMPMQVALMTLGVSNCKGPNIGRQTVAREPGAKQASRFENKSKKKKKKKKKKKQR